MFYNTKSMNDEKVDWPKNWRLVKNHNFCPIIMKLWENEYLMSS